ncbi:MAG: 2-oxoacid:acceptor oxidoreductase family protein [Promethearchaeati archaeon SRVP18_Atabeyarchaeia-1]
MRKYSVLVVGVGGQGIMTIGNILKKAGQRKGWIVVGTETRGASQREGSVDNSVRYVMLDPGEERNERTSVISPLIPMAGADLIIALETNEALRSAKFASGKTSVLVNLYEILPPQAVSEKWKGATFDEVINIMKTFSDDVRAIRANEISKNEFGDFSMSNMIMLGGALGMGKMPLSSGDIREAMEEEFGGSMPNVLKGLEIGMNEIGRTGDAGRRTG